MKPRSISHLSFPLAGVALLAAPTTHAASAAWNVDALGTWVTAGNWTPAAAPGSAVTDNPDIATFSKTLTAGRTVTVDTTRFIGGITFDHSSGFGHTLSGGSLRLNNGSVIQNSAGNGAHVDTISSPILLSGTTVATLAFNANATSASSLLSIGAVTGSSTSTTSTVLTLGGLNTGANIVSGIVANGAGGPLSIFKSDAGQWILSAANTCSGATKVIAGTLSLGNSLTLQNSAFDTLNSISGDPANGLKTTVTALTVGGLNGNKDLASVFTTTSGGYSGVTALTLNLGNGSTHVYSGIITDGAVGMTLTKTGQGAQTLSGANSHTGGTTVSAGTLFWSGANPLPGTGTLTVGTGATFSLADGTARTTAGAAADVGLSLAPGSSLAFDWNGGSLDALTTAGTASAAAGNVAININTASPTGSGGTLISATGASTLDAASYFLANNTDFTATLASTPTTVSIGARSAVAPLTDAYWLGGQVTGAADTLAYSLGNLSNWASDAAGTLAGGVVPGGSSVNVIFGAAGVTTSSVVTGASMNLGSITFNDDLAVTLAGAGTTITLNSTAATAASTTAALATVTPGSAISVTSFASTANSIGAHLALGANQTWNVASGSTLTVSGVVSGLFGLTKSDGGTVKLTGVNTFTGPINVNGGTLEFSYSGAGLSAYASNQININGASTLKISGGTSNVPIYAGKNYTFDATGGGSILVGTGNYNAAASAFTITSLGGAKDTIGLISTSSAFGLNIGTVGGTFDIALGSDAASDLTVTPIITNSGAVTKTGTGRLTLSAVNTFTGRLTVQNGTLGIATINNSSAVGPLGNNALSVVLGSSGGKTGTLGYTGATATSSKKFTLATGGGGAFDIATGATVLTLGGVMDGSGTLTKSGAGTLILSGANTFTGSTEVTSGTLELATTGQLKFVLGAATGVNNSLTGSGTATLKGSFAIDTSAADSLSSGTWLLESVTSLTGAYDATFSVAGFVNAGGDKWTKANGASKSYTFDEATGVLTLATTGGYAGWQSANGTVQAIDLDHDLDGVKNGVEYFLGGNTDTTGFTPLPGVINPGGSPSVTWTKAASYTGTYGTDFVVETSSTLSGAWAPEPADPTPGFTVTFPTAAEVKFSFPAGTRNFARLKVTGP